MNEKLPLNGRSQEIYKGREITSNPSLVNEYSRGFKNQDAERYILIELYGKKSLRSHLQRFIPDEEKLDLFKLPYVRANGTVRTRKID
jgi:hypothetical protein